MVRRGSYVGITDVPNAEWLLKRCRVFQEAGALTIPLLLHAGVMMSRKSLHSKPTKYAAVWPKPEEIADIFAERDARMLRILHYADYDAETTVSDVQRAVIYGGHCLDGIQFDMPWPQPELLRAVKEEDERLRIILQVGTRALAEVGNDPARMVERLWDYEGDLDDVLLDKSGGEGRGMDAEELRPFVAALRAERRGLGITVAGGLGPDTLHLVAPLIRDFPDLSIDAQGQLRTSGSSKDPIEADRVDAYLRRAVEMFLAAVPTGAPV